MTRWKAALIHLSLSLAVLLVLGAVLVWRWYPPGLFHMAQADKLLVLIGGVDLVLGPLLTLIVYKQGKKSLKFDLTTIALMQLAALVFGLHATWESRPVYMVAAVDRFDLMFANEIDREDLAHAPPAYRRLPAFGAHLVGVVIPTDPAAREKALMDALAGKDLPASPSRYLPYDAVAPTLLAHARPLNDWLRRLSSPSKARLLEAASATGKPIHSLVAVPIESSRGDAAMLLSDKGVPLRPVAVSLLDAAPAKSSAP